MESVKSLFNNKSFRKYAAHAICALGVLNMAIACYNDIDVAGTAFVGVGLVFLGAKSLHMQAKANQQEEKPQAPSGPAP